MTSMIEKVARAISLSQTQTETMWQAFLPEARAAIEAMREPTEAMIESAIPIVPDCGSPHNYPEPIWQEVIDAALKEEA